MFIGRRISQVKKREDLIFLITFIAAVTAVACAVRCPAEVELVEPDMLYEVKDHPDTGFFQYIVSVAVCEEEGALYVLGGAPDSLNVYHRDNGIPKGRGNHQLPVQQDNGGCKRKIQDE